MPSNDGANGDWGEGPRLTSAQARIAELEAELAEARKDGKRLLLVEEQAYGIRSEADETGWHVWWKGQIMTRGVGLCDAIDARESPNLVRNTLAVVMTYAAPHKLVDLKSAISEELGDPVRARDIVQGEDPEGYIVGLSEERAGELLKLLRFS